MSFIFAYFYDNLMLKTEEACLKEWRQKLLKNVSGNVLEIGAGTGANIEFYSEDVNLVLAEPDKNMRQQIESKISNSNLKNALVSTGTAEQIEAEDDSFDFVVSTLVCCSVTKPERSLLEIKRVLKPGGSLVFLEHVGAKQGSKRRRWQNIINPFWKKLAGNCHLNRDTEASILSAGFKINDIKRESMRKTIPIVRPAIRGMAVKQ